LNDSGGKGVDIFHSYSCSDSSLFEADQCKCKGDITVSDLTTLCQSVRKVIPARWLPDPTIYEQTQQENTGQISHIIGIYSRSVVVQSKVPQDCFVVDRTLLLKYFGLVFAHHPLVEPCVFVNDPLVKSSWIESVISNGATASLGLISEAIVACRSKMSLANSTDLIKFSTQELKTWKTSLFLQKKHLKRNLDEADLSEEDIQEAKKRRTATLKVCKYLKVSPYMKFEFI